METGHFSLAESEIEIVKVKAWHWAASCNTCCLLDCFSEGYPSGGFKSLIAAGQKRAISDKPALFSDLHDLQRQNWLFGFLGYDLKNTLEDLHSNNPDAPGFPDCFLFEPETVLQFHENEVVITAQNPVLIFETISAFTILQSSVGFKIAEPVCQTTRTEYLNNVELIRNHIAEGDIYELNYCLEFQAQTAQFNPFQAWLVWQKMAEMPFTGYLQFGTYAILSASPERFLRKQGQNLLAQPIKGTSPRDPDPKKDLSNKNALKTSEKEMAENMMITDLTRNDLARSAKPGTTEVSELFGLYSFPHLHQMITSVNATLHPETKWSQAIANAFPVGSMTGAPKIRAMQLIEQYENFKRGPYSGTLGYISPNTDFDFNVLIRSLFYNSEKEKITFSAGSAITWDSQAEAEYEECLLKTKGVMGLIKRLNNQAV